MTNGEAKQLQTDVIIFPMEFNGETQTTDLIDEKNAEIRIDEPLIKTDIRVRFARLKKSLRKRSASIL